MKSTFVFFVLLGVTLSQDTPNFQVKEDSENSRCIWTFATDVPPSGCPVTFPAAGMSDAIKSHIKAAAGDWDSMAEQHQLRRNKDGNNALKQQLERQDMTNDMEGLQAQIDQLTAESTRMEEHLEGMQSHMDVLMSQVEKLMAAVIDLQTTSG